jgi:REP element-mobilizing transposase RayT
VKLTISKDNPCLFITAVANHRLPVFKTDAIKKVTCEAIDEARTSCGFLLFAYVLMPDHIHQNPVRAGLAERAEDYKWSSARFGKKCPREDEPLKVDIERIVWRRS